MAILSLDQGTTSSRAVIFDNEGRILSMKQTPIKQYYPKPGWVEHDALEILQTEIECASRCVEEYGGEIEAVGITNQRETVILWDRETGDPVYRAIVWQCRRTAPMCDVLISEGFDRYIFEATGLTCDAYFSGTKIKWMLDNVPKARELADKGRLLCGTVDCWLIWNLTGNHYTDITNASRTMLFDIRTLDWNVTICDKLGIPMSILPKVKGNSDYFGEIVKSGRVPENLWGKKIYSSVGDQQAALFGQQCINVGDVKNTYGTGCFTLMNIGAELRYVKNLITTVAWKIGDETVYAIEGSVFNAGSSIQWLRDELHLINSARECDIYAEKVEDTGGAVFVSAFTGLGAPHWDMHARGMLLGVTRGTTREHVCRAVLEGIAFQVADLIKTIENGTGCDVSVLKVDGGASVSDVMLQFQSDILGCVTDRPLCVESTALGAAYFAALGAGIVDREGLVKLRKTDRSFTPSMSPNDAARKYNIWKNAIDSVRLFAQNSINV